MLHRVTALVLGLVLALTLAFPVLAGDFPEQPGDLPACPVVQSLPKDIIGHLFGVSPGAAERLVALLTDACLGG